jgi:hypothetical protein
MLATLTAATPPQPATWTLTLTPNTITFSALASLALAAVFDYFGIGPAHIADRVAAGFAVAGFSHLTFDGAGSVNKVALKWMMVNAQWAAFTSSMIGLVSLALLVGMFLPENDNLGRFTRQQFRRRKSSARFNYNVWVWPLLVSAFPMSSGLIALITRPLIALVVAAFTQLTKLLIGY